MPSTSSRLGADRCPGLLQTFSADDGEIARLRLPGGRVSTATLLEIVCLAGRLGAPFLQLTSRGSLQLRGLPDPVPTALVTAVTAAGLLPSTTHDRARTIAAAPLALELDPLVDELDDAVLTDPTLAALPGRWLWVLADETGAGLDLPYDVAWQSLGDGWGRLLVVGCALDVPRERAVGAMTDVARAFLATRSDERTWNTRDLVDPSVLASGLTPVDDAAGAATPVGQHGDDLVVGVPLGLLTREHAEALRSVADEVRVTPWKSIALRGNDSAHGTLEDVGLLTRPGDPATALTACMGAPYCRRTESPTLTIAREAAAATAGPLVPTHVVGCDRACGRPRDARLVVAPISAADVLATARGDR